MALPISLADIHTEPKCANNVDHSGARPIFIDFSCLNKEINIQHDQQELIFRVDNLSNSKTQSSTTDQEKKILDMEVIDKTTEDLQELNKFNQVANELVHQVRNLAIRAPILTNPAKFKTPKIALEDCDDDTEVD